MYGFGYTLHASPVTSSRSTYTSSSRCEYLLSETPMPRGRRRARGRGGEDIQDLRITVSLDRGHTTHKTIIKKRYCTINVSEFSSVRVRLLLHVSYILVPEGFLRTWYLVTCTHYSEDVGNAALRVTKTTSSAVSVLVVAVITEPGTAGDRSDAASVAEASPPLPRSTPACCSAVRTAAQLTLFGSSTSKWPSRLTWR